MTQVQMAPNLFTLANKHVHISYSTSSITGEPQLSYQDQQAQHTFRGDEIRTQTSEIGTLVTVTLEHIPDLHIITLTLLLPQIEAARTETAFRTRAILTTHNTSFVGPGVARGALQTYRVIALRGTAEVVDF